MKHHITIFSVCLLVALGTLTVQGQTVSGTSADEQMIRQLIEKHASSARKDDVAGMISTMHSDVVTRLDDGRVLAGRSANAKFLQEIAAGGPHHLAHHHPLESINIRFLTSEIAFVDVDSVSVSGSGPRTPYFLLFTKVDGEWGVAEVRNGPGY